LINFSDEGFEVPFLSCGVNYKDDQTVDDFNYPIDHDAKCTCNNCFDKCDNIDWDKILVPPSVWNGFNIQTVFGFGVMFVVTVFALILNAILKKKKNRNKSNSVDSYEKIKDDIGIE